MPRGMKRKERYIGLAAPVAVPECESLLLGGFLCAVRASDDDVFSVRAAGYGGTSGRFGRFQTRS